MNVRELQHLALAMAHEVRNPLNSMAIHIELLEGRLHRDTQTAEDREAGLKSVAVLVHEVERIDRILEEYLKYVAPADPVRAAVEPARLLADAARRAQASADARNVRFEIKAAAALEPWLIDPSSLGEALDVLIANAIESSPAASTVTLSASSEGDHAEIVVADRGQGIAAADLPQIFQLGFSRRGRSGVGLTIAKQIVKGYGGSLSAQNGSEGGARFTIRVPLETE